MSYCIEVSFDPTTSKLLVELYSQVCAHLDIEPIATYHPTVVLGQWDTLTEKEVSSLTSWIRPIAPFTLSLANPGTLVDESGQLYLDIDGKDYIEYLRSTLPPTHAPLLPLNWFPHLLLLSGLDFNQTLEALSACQYQEFPIYGNAGGLALVQRDSHQITIFSEQLWV